MNTYEHFFWNYAIFHRKPWAWKVAVGGLVPDMVYFVAFFPKVFSYGSFMEWMHDPLWHIVWDSFVAKSVHSLAIWSAFLILFLVIFKKETLGRVSPFLWGWGLHITSDALTHVSDGYALFFPLSDYRFAAPVSYWETEFHAKEFFWISHTLMAGLFLLWMGARLRRFLQTRNGTTGNLGLTRSGESASNPGLKADLGPSALPDGTDSPE